MGDLAPRPRGGWQVGTSFRRDRGRGPYGDTRPDPAPDVYSVAREDGAFLVQHFPTADVAAPCCVVRVRRRPGESDVDTLARASQMCDRRHQEAAR